MADKTYLAIDLKSFYASVECMELGLDPMTTNLVVADLSRTEKTICLAVSPSLKEYRIPGRARLFEVVQRVKEVTDLTCEKDEMLLVNYEAPNGEKRHNRLWNGGNGRGTVELWEHDKLIDRIRVENAGCEYGEYTVQEATR